MTAWHRGELLAADTETTGPNPDTARIVTATLIELSPGHAPVVHEWLIDPGVEISAGATAVHGISTEHAREHGRDAFEAIFEITGLLGLWLGRGKPVVAMNAAFDLTILDRECRRYDIESLSDRLGDPRPIIDPFVLDKHAHQYRKGSRTLTALCEHYGVRQDDAHTSTGDALAAARVAFALAERFRELRVTPADLHLLQKVWRRDQSESLQAYFRSHGQPDAVCNGDWPIQGLPDSWDPAAVDQQELAEVI